MPRTTASGARREPAHWMSVLMPIAGALLTLSFAPFGLWPTGIAGVALLGYSLCTCSPRLGALRGWLFGAGLFGTGASWVYVSIHVHGAAPVPLAALLTVFFCAGLALLPAAFAAAYAAWIRPLPGGMLLGFPALWVLFEGLRSWLLTGFPWLFLGYAHLDSWLAGWAPVAGVYGVSFAVALTASCLFLAWRSRRPIALLVYSTLLVVLWGGGRMLEQVDWVAPASELPISVALYQPNIPQKEKWDRRYYRDILHRYETAIGPQLEHDIVLWPESAIPRLYRDARAFLDPIDRRARLADSTLITGIPTAPEAGVYHNSILALGQGSGLYHKQRLVPFGEYVPLERWLRGLIAFFDLPMSNFSRGPAGQDALRAGSYRAAPFICYEIVYPGLVARGARRADLLVTISNDSWFGASIGPLQHLEMARMRALENGRYLLRGTNNGVSAIIDHRGRVLARTAQFEEATLVGDARSMLGHTPFTSFGSLPIIIACLVTLLLLKLLALTAWRAR
ncbi:apolipoprotein N-acyltransferase [Pseudohaliea rubra]|uniref:Apolipoprotein N-acyltransferase n=1 Tax=Pseudohaliea rubra DSM 19751 TaxID=1265313 RepID=A0A095VR11_9GAMM|nr:apolipoprotein N-acyltransferase [Pseudohaliea rubra]KGE03907.1 Apolipoprotein N-acyltransferase/ Copper homeostasis protein CutE [Pseudohaliea rubra DSM 19751]